MKLFKTILILLFLNFSNYTLASEQPEYNSPETNSSELNDNSCDITFVKNTLINGWFDWDPYSYMDMSIYGAKITGFDIELIETIAKEVGMDVKFEKNDWPDLISGIQNGKKDVLPGATYSKERSAYAYFSEPYRTEKNTLYVSKHTSKKLNFKNIEEFLAQIRSLDFKIAVLKDTLYADNKLNEFISDPLNADIITSYVEDIEGFRALLRGSVDGFITDRMVGATIIIKNNMGGILKEVPLNIETPISLMLSKKTISPEFRNKVNTAIIKLKNDGLFKEIQRKYLYPVFVLGTVNSDWFHYITIIGVIAFALSGVALSVRDNMTLFGTYFLALLPSLGGIMLKEIYGGVGNNFANFTLYQLIILGVVLVGFSAVRILDAFNKDAKKDNLIEVFWHNFFVITDALGQACFIVIGVTVVIVTKLSPIIVWGPIFSFLAANGGGMFRDLFTNDKQISALKGDINAEVTIFWALLFSIFLQYTSDEPSITIISIGATIVVIGAFLTRLATVYLKIDNIRFR